MSEAKSGQYVNKLPEQGLGPRDQSKERAYELGWGEGKTRNHAQKRRTLDQGRPGMKSDWRDRQRMEGETHERRSSKQGR